MKISYLLDTDWVIHYLNGHEKIIEKLKSSREEGLAISVISLAELYEGVYHSKDPDSNAQSLNDFLTDVSILGIDEEVSKIFGKERGRLRKEKRLIGDFDLLIASTCLYYNLTLFTNNKKHYQLVKGLNFFSLLK